MCLKTSSGALHIYWVLLSRYAAICRRIGSDELGLGVTLDDDILDRKNNNPESLSLSLSL